MRPIAAPFLLVLLAALPACSQGGAPAGVPAATGSRWIAVEDLVRKKDYPAAYDALEAMRVPDQPDAELTLRLGEVRRLQGEPVKAILLLRQGLEAQPKAFQLVAPLAALYLQVDDNAQARLCDGRYFVAESGELGEGGMSIVTDFVLTEGHQLVVSLQIPHGDFVFLRAVAKSTEKKMGDHLVTHGLSFENVGFSIKRQIRVFVSARKEIQLSSG